MARYGSSCEDGLMVILCLRASGRMELMSRRARHRPRSDRPTSSDAVLMIGTNVRHDETVFARTVVIGVRELGSLYRFEGIDPFDRKCRLRLVDWIGRILPVGFLGWVGRISPELAVVRFEILRDVGSFATSRAEEVASQHLRMRTSRSAFPLRSGGRAPPLAIHRSTRSACRDTS
jgi:hypothetical protein